MTSSGWDVNLAQELCVSSSSRGCAKPRRIIPVLVHVAGSSCTMLLSRDFRKDAPDSYLQMPFKFIGYFLFESFFCIAGT